MKVILFFTFCFLPSAFCLAVDWNNPDAVVQAANEVNPSLASLSAQIRAAKERVAPAGSLPNPMLMGGVQNEPVNLSYDFMTMYMVGASQTLVRKSRRDALRRSAELDVGRLQREYESRRAEVERDVRSAYIEAAAAQNQVESTEDIATVLESVVEASRARYETGAVPQADLIRAMLEESNVEHQLIALRRQRNAALARLLPLLELPATTPVPPFSLRHAMHAEHEGGFNGTLPESTPAIAELQAELARAEEDIRLAKLATRPDVSVEASYGVRPRNTDMFSLTARVELPIRKSAIIEPRIREAIARRDGARQQIEVLRQQLLQDLGSELVSRNEAIEQIDIHINKLVPQAKIGFESSLAAYQTGKTTFDAVLGSLRTYVALNVDYYDFLRQKMLAEVDIKAMQRGARSGAAPAKQSMEMSQ
ncbi:MAG TPA: TolC family protein [Thermoanaerobaculia bacterium]|nr:TolC family protein [Thermoanaerobaculia bacterium]